MKLIPEARQALKLRSIQVLTAASVVWSAWLVLPPEQQASIAAMLGFDLSEWGPLIAFAAAIWARLQAQPALHRD